MLNIRNKLGQSSKLHSLQEEEEMKKAAQERRRDKEETKAARERVKAQIEQDRADRAAR